MRKEALWVSFFYACTSRPSRILKKLGRTGRNNV